MTIADADVRAFAEQLQAAERDGTSVPLASEVFPDLDWDGARRIALQRDELRRSDGDTCIGYKLGWTSAAMRLALGIDRPNWGTLWESQHIAGSLRTDEFRHAKVEPEIVYVAGHKLQGDRITAGDVIDRASGWAVGIEVVHPRWDSFDFTWLDNTADNSSSAAVAIGTVSQIGPNADIAHIEVSFSNGTEWRTGLGEEAMGTPAEAVAWLTRQLATEDRAIEPGHIVFTGGLTAPFDVTAGSRFTAESTALGNVSFVAARK